MPELIDLMIVFVVMAGLTENALGSLDSPFLAEPLSQG
jgi:hypothetical protein